MITSHCSFCSNVVDAEHGPQLVGVTSFTGPDAGALPGAGDVIKHRDWRDIFVAPMRARGLQIRNGCFAAPETLD
jgi:hypothetical protein